MQENLFIVRNKLESVYEPEFDPHHIPNAQKKFVVVGNKAKKP